MGKIKVTMANSGWQLVMQGMHDMEQRAARLAADVPFGHLTNVCYVGLVR